MKKIIPLMLSGLLLLGATACSENPNTAGNTDGNSLRSNQIESDGRARDQRDGMNSATNSQQQTTGDLAVDVRNSLETKLPGSRLAVNVDNDNGMATINGTVPTQKQFDEIKPIVMAFDGIKSVDIKAEVDAN